MTGSPAGWPACAPRTGRCSPRCRAGAATTSCAGSGSARDPVEAARQFAEWTRAPVDIGYVTGPDGSPRAFLGIASLGFDSDVQVRANRTRLIRGSSRLHLRCAAHSRRLAAGDASRCSADDGRRREARRLVGGGGEFGVLRRRYALRAVGVDRRRIARTRHRRALQQAAFPRRCCRRCSRDVTSTTRACSVRRARKIQVDADRPFQVYADGDPLADLPATISVTPGGLRLLGPGAARSAASKAELRKKIWLNPDNRPARLRAPWQDGRARRDRERDPGLPRVASSIGRGSWTTSAASARCAVVVLAVVALAGITLTATSVVHPAATHPNVTVQLPASSPDSQPADRRPEPAGAARPAAPARLPPPRPTPPRPASPAPPRSPPAPGRSRRRRWPPTARPPRPSPSRTRRCHLTWPLLAGIGKVETDHGRSWGAAARITATGEVVPTILGPVLNGHNGTALVLDTDGGAYDHDRQYDRAVGPMQFVPATWPSSAATATATASRTPTTSGTPPSRRPATCAAATATCPTPPICARRSSPTTRRPPTCRRCWPGRAPTPKAGANLPALDGVPDPLVLGAGGSDGRRPVR